MDPLQEPPHPPTPTTPVDWGFWDPSAQFYCSPRRADAPSDPRNTSTTSTSSKGENALLRKLLLRRLADLNKITSKVVDDDTDLEKVKVLHTRTVPKVEKAVRELENTLQQYSRICDPIDLADLSDQVDAATEEATKFIDNIAALYDELRTWIKWL